MTQHIGIEHFGAIGPTIALDEGMLIEFPRLNMSHLNRGLGTPRHEAFGDESRAIVEPKRLRVAAPGHDLLKYANHTLRRQ